MLVFLDDFAPVVHDHLAQEAEGLDYPRTDLNEKLMQF